MYINMFILLPFFYDYEHKLGYKPNYLKPMKPKNLAWKFVYTVITTYLAVIFIVHK